MVAFTIVTLAMDSASNTMCSPVWCICVHKQLSNKQLDEFVKQSQLQTDSSNYAYLEWIPFDCIGVYLLDY